VLSSFVPGSGLGFRSNAGESDQESPHSCKNPWFRRRSSVLELPPGR
jgi:hypothetical protein